MKKLTAILSIILATTSWALANPIPRPLPASMPLENMRIRVMPSTDGLSAVFTGEFVFAYIPEEVNSMLFPVPPDANSIRVTADNIELAWIWSSEDYPTVLPEMPTMPMIEWQGPFPNDGAVLGVDYEHDLIKRPNEFIFFYAVGTGKYFPTYDKTTTANFDILLPAGFKVAGVWLDETPHEYEVIGSHLMVTVQSYFGPIINDLIVSLTPTTVCVATDGNDVTGDGSEQNPFATIQKGIDSTVDGDAVIVHPGRYTENINFIGKNITLRSTDPMDQSIVANTIIDGNDVNSVVTFSGNESCDCVLSGFTITSGEAPEGGGIYGNFTKATIENNVIIGNRAVGYGIPGSYGTGGGLLDCDGLIQDNIITENHGGFGGGAACCDGRIKNNIISYNGWYAGGGMYCCSGEINNNLLIGNEAVLGGALSCCNGIIRNCTVVGNLAHGSGLDSCNGSISNCIIWKNGAGVWVQIEDCSTPAYSCIEGWIGGGIGNTSAEPCFANMGYWQQQGGIWRWVDDGADYHLRSQTGRWDPNQNRWVTDANSSPCIDAGDPDSNLAMELWPHGKRINMGAFGGTPQASMSLSNVGDKADLNNDDIVDFRDFSHLADSWQRKDVPLFGDFDRNGTMDFNDLAIFADNWVNGIEAFTKPTLAKYYQAYDNPVEPNAPGYNLPLNLNDIVNYAVMDFVFGLNNSAALLEQNGFAIIEHDFGSFDPNRDDIVKPYEYLRMREVPIFVTSDTLLHLYHIQFDETLKDVEEREFCTDIRDLTAVLLTESLAMYGKYTGELKEAAKRNVAYLAVAQQLIEPGAQVPTFVANMVGGELANISAHEGFANSGIFIYKEDYSQYVPRGHYTRSEQLKRYFRTLMWYGRMAFLLKGAEIWGPTGDALISLYDAKIQTLQAILLASSIDKVQVDGRTGRQVWERMYAVTAFYVGLADDLTPYEYLGAVDRVFGSSFQPADLLDEDNFFALKVELALLRSPNIFGGTGNVMVTPPVTPESLDEVLDKAKGMRFMGQRFIPDSYMFQHLVFPEVLDYTGDADPRPFTYGFTGVRWARCYPRGLDVMAILGSEQAQAISVELGETDYVNYWQQFSELKAEFDAFDISDWNRNLYWGWLYALRALISEFGEGYPNFMRTQAWEKKELNAALASWTELRHDTILYAKQSHTPVETSLPPDVTGYVEPVPEFYGRLLALTQMTRQGLSDLDALSAQATERLVNFEGTLNRLIEIANKELTSQMLSEDDYEYIMEFAKTLESAVIGVEDKGLKTTLVADVHTHTAEGKVVEEGVGYVDLIIVACPVPDGSIFLAAGPVLSYYEFKHPMSDRLTDEAWREMLASPARPDRPRWFQPLVR